MFWGRAASPFAAVRLPSAWKALHVPSFHDHFARRAGDCPPYPRPENTNVLTLCCTGAVQGIVHPPPFVSPGISTADAQKRIPCSPWRAHREGRASARPCGRKTFGNPQKRKPLHHPLDFAQSASPSAPRKFSNDWKKLPCQAFVRCFPGAKAPPKTLSNQNLSVSPCLRFLRVWRRRPLPQGKILI